mgnify:CR=1 FL=1|tara:strand:+ start:1659 stop:1913 length:255 start_codon:yes stop_codon:yes gene_type:complete
MLDLLTEAHEQFKRIGHKLTLDLEIKLILEGIDADLLVKRFDEGMTPAAIAESHAREMKVFIEQKGEELCESQVRKVRQSGRAS